MIFSKTKECPDHRIIFQGSYISSLAIGMKKTIREKKDCKQLMSLRAGQCVGELQERYYCPLEGALWSIVTRWRARDKWTKEWVSLSTSFLNDNNKEK